MDFGLHHKKALSYATCHIMLYTSCYVIKFGKTRTSQRMLDTDMRPASGIYDQCL